MSDEFIALMNNGTWSLVPPQPNFIYIIGNKSAFRLKRNPDGSISQYKSWLVAKGFHPVLIIRTHSACRQASNNQYGVMHSIVQEVESDENGRQRCLILIMFQAK